MSAQLSLQSVGEGLVIGEDVENPAFEEMADMSHALVGSEELATERAVPSCCRLESLGKESEWLPSVVH